MFVCACERVCVCVCVCVCNCVYLYMSACVRAYELPYIYIIQWLNITTRYFTDPLGVIEDVPICNVGVFRDLTQCGDTKYIIFILITFSFRRF